jgi:hypothetical protein
MESHFIDIVRSSAGLLAGGVIGLSFGAIQDAARRRHERLQLRGGLSNAWSIVPGSGARVAYLLVALVLVQVLCPLLFVEGTQWWISGGLVAGYGWSLLQKAVHLRKVNRA